MKRKRRQANSIPRIALVAVSVLVQTGWLLLTILKLNQYYAWISLATGLLTAVVVLKLYSISGNNAQRMSWIILILILPVMGLALYLMVEVFGDPAGAGRRLERIRRELRPWLRHRSEAVEELGETDPAAANTFRYLWNHTDSPASIHTSVRYHHQGKLALEDLKQALEKAEKFIFMEYFILENGSAFREIREILVRKSRQGVEVRVLYDDFGSVGYVNTRFARQLNRQGIRCRAFNPALPVMNLFMNHRDHRKITVIDGKVAFTGGYNLADEYFDRIHPYGHWKDTGLRMEGEAVRSLTAAFLELWQITTREREDYSQYLEVDYEVSGDCLVQPYGDNPLGKERAAENVYLNLAAQAKHTLWFMTPYLIITDEMTRALALAAKRGVDVRIILPGIPDKKMVYQVTRSFFAGLAGQGVKLYTYTPGFCHGKMCVCDGKLVSIGTSNLDYRSLYLHFENNVLLWGGEAVEAVVRDFEETFGLCREVTQDYLSGRGSFLLTWQCLLRLFSPLM